MAKRVRKQCPSCQQLFLGRRDAKTCSERCRKRLQRARMSVAESPVINFGHASSSMGVFDNRYTKTMATRRSAERGAAI